MDVEPPPRRLPLLSGLLVGLAVLAFGATMQGPPDLGPVMAEVDGVHPVRAAAALDRAYALGGGFLDKYPPLGSVVMGLVGWVADPGFGEAVAGIEELEPGPRRAALFEHGERIARLVRIQRGVSLVAMAAVLGLLAWATAAGARALGASTAATLVGVQLVLMLFGTSDVVVYHGSSTNVDALVLLASVIALLGATTGRFRTAAVALGLAVAVKDPAFVLGPVVLAAAWWRGGARLALPTLLVSLGVYAVAAGALTGPSLWWDHVVYLLHGGVEQVDRIDPGDVSQWPQLLRLVGRLLVDGLTPVGLALASFGFVVAQRLPGRGPGRPGLLVLFVLAATVALFVLPVGFVYARFLLVPTAGLAVLAGLAAVALTERLPSPAAWGLAVGLAAIGALQPGTFLGDRELAGLWWERREPLPRRAAAERLAQEFPPGSTVVLFADEREHGPPVDPRDFDLDVRGLDDLIPSVTAWREGARPLPDAVLLMTFATDPPSGRAPEPPSAPHPGQKVAGLLEVVSVHGRPRGTRSERTLPWRPTVTLLRPVR